MEKDEQCFDDDLYRNIFAPLQTSKLIDIIEEEIIAPNKTNKTCKTIIDSDNGKECLHLYNECTFEDPDTKGKLSKMNIPNKSSNCQNSTLIHI